MVNSILRISDVEVTNSTTIVATFEHTLSLDLLEDNVIIESQSLNSANSIVSKVSVSGKILTITCQPLASQEAYYVKFVSGANDFKDRTSTFFIVEDGKQNVQLIIGPVDSDNIFMDKMLSAYQNNIYDLSSGTVAYNLFESYATLFSKALADINQVKNENYLSKTILDEKHTRGPGAYDRLNEEGVYELLRVSKYKLGVFFDGTIAFDSFPRKTINLLDVSVEEIINSSSFDGIGLFNINNLTLTLDNNLVSSLSSLTFATSSNGTYVYDIKKYGYQLLDNKYDNDYAFKFLSLNSNQIRLSEAVLSDPNFIPATFSTATVSYTYRDLGRKVDSTTVSVYNDLNVVREVISPITTSFNLKNYPILDVDGNIATTGAVTFNDPNSDMPFLGIHPAFKNEIVFGMDNLPSVPGEFCVDYATGQVFVFGSDLSNSGTGAFPPVASYRYRYTYQVEVDYVYDADSSDMVAIRTRNLDLQPATISYKYEQVLTPGIDFKDEIHTEVLNERVGGRIIANQNAIQVANSPITNVFRVYNETQGEIYKVSRTSGNKIYFSYNSPPNIENISGERVSFEFISNEPLVPTSDASVVINSISRRVLTFYLANTNIVSATEDCVGTSFNSSASFSDNQIFKNEKYLRYSDSISSLISASVGDYCVDYKNGIVYVIVDPSFDHQSVGTISYKRPYIATKKPHVVNVIDIYYRKNPFQPKDKSFNFTSFGEGFIKPVFKDVAAEGALNNDDFFPYTILNGPVGSFIGATIGTTFTPGVTSNVQSVRHLFDKIALNTFGPGGTIDFADSCTFSDNKIKVLPKEIKFVGLTDSQFKVDTGLSTAQIANVFETQFLFTRLSDNRTFVGIGDFTGSTIKVHTAETQIANDTILITAFVSINSGNEVIVDYNRGEYYVDYSYLADEIIVSYEYGDNVLDFRQSTSVLQGEDYYVSYRVGALRDALLKNFGTLINIPQLNVFDPNLNRERYRDSLKAALSSFTTGPTLNSLKNIVSTITHATPEVSETIFESWSLGNSILYPEKIYSENLQFTKGKFGDAFLMNTPGQLIKFPATSNIRLEEGTFQEWVTPEWNGLDNESELTFVVKKNGTAINVNEIFIGSVESHPQVSSGTFTVSKNGKISPFGIPNMQKDGIFIYLAFDALINANRWYITTVNSGAATYSFEISSTGKYFDVKVQNGSGSSLTSTENKVYFITTNVASSLTFVSDQEYYLLDIGENFDRNRISLYRDSAGYIVFRAIDAAKKQYSVSANVRNWKSNETHLVACSWALNSQDERDELHLFIDGVEVPNIVRYGTNKTFGNNFRDISTEELFAQILTKRAASGASFITTAGSNLVHDADGFNSAQPVVGDKLFINEAGFDPLGYDILAVDSVKITVSANLPISLTNVRYTINKTSLTTQTSVDIYKNISVTKVPTIVSGFGDTSSGNTFTFTSVNTGAVSMVSGAFLRIEADGFPHDFTVASVAGNVVTVNETISSLLTNLFAYIYAPSAQVELAGPRSRRPDYLVQNISGIHSLDMINNVLPGDLIKINSLGLNFRRFQKSYYQWSTGIDNVLRTKFPTPISLDEVKIFKTILAPLTLSSDTPTTLVDIPTKTFITTLTSFELVSNTDDDRKMQLTISGFNLDFTGITIHITGTSQAGSVMEAITPTKAGTYDLASRYSSLTEVKVYGKYISSGMSYGVIGVKEKSPITTMDTSGVPPVIQFTFQTQVSDYLTCAGGDTVTDSTANFIPQIVGGTVHIFTPSVNAGYYKIIAVSLDGKSIQLDQQLPAFTSTRYEVLTSSINRNGFQNGFFTFEKMGMPRIPYLLNAGHYDFDYNTYISIKFDRFAGNVFVGSDLKGQNLAHAGLDNIIVRSRILTDTRTGEMSDVNVGSVTREFNALKPTVPDATMLVVLNPVNRTPVNSAYNYLNKHGKYIQTGKSVNPSFGQSLVAKKSHLTIDNLGILNSHKEGTIETWVNPEFDTGNDPNYRFYFDANATVSEEVISFSNIQIILPWAASKIASIYVNGDSQTNYSIGSSLGVDGKTITLKKALPNEKSSLTVNYIPAGASGDRISIYKDNLGNAIFNIRASGTDYQIRSQIDWAKNTWHRLKATWKVNGGKGTDEIRFYIDGFERGTLLFGSGLLFGDNIIFGQSPIGKGGLVTSINFTDSINQFTIGSDFSGANHGACLLDNFRISNVSRPGVIALQSSIDQNYNANTAMAIPVVSDLYTTYLLDFNSSFVKNTDFTLLKNKNFGAFDFSVNVLDSFGIVADSSKVKEVLEALVKSLKPANSRVYIKYNQ